MNERLAAYYRRQIADLTRIIRIKTEDIAELSEKKTWFECALRKLEAKEDADSDC